MKNFKADIKNHDELEEFVKNYEPTSVKNELEDMSMELDPEENVEQSSKLMSSIPARSIKIPPKRAKRQMK